MPITKASPIPTGNARDIPAASMAITSSRFARLNKAPLATARNAGPAVSVCRFVMAEARADPMLPSEKQNTMPRRATPIA